MKTTTRKRYTIEEVAVIKNNTSNKKAARLLNRTVDSVAHARKRISDGTMSVLKRSESNNQAVANSGERVQRNYPIDHLLKGVKEVIVEGSKITFKY